MIQWVSIDVPDFPVRAGGVHRLELVQLRLRRLRVFRHAAALFVAALQVFALVVEQGWLHALLSRLS